MHGFIEMHDLLKVLGRKVVKESTPKEPEKRSRLWFHEDSYYVMSKGSMVSSYLRIQDIGFFFHFLFGLAYH